MHRQKEARNTPREIMDEIIGRHIHTGQGVLYPSIIRDLYTTVLLPTKWVRSKPSSLYSIPVGQPRKIEKVTAELQLHSDQGFQYTSAAYFHLPQSYGITFSMSRQGNRYDNPWQRICFPSSKPSVFSVFTGQNLPLFSTQEP